MELLHPFSAVTEECTQGALDRVSKDFTGRPNFSQEIYFLPEVSTSLLHQRPLGIILRINFGYPLAATKYNFRKALHFIARELYLHVDRKK